MTGRRYVAILLDDEHVTQWELGLFYVVRAVERQKALHGLDTWPELAYAERESQWTWKLVFAWPHHVVKLCDDGWAWRCWECGWHGVGLYSETAARRELAGHPCQPGDSDE